MPEGKSLPDPGFAGDDGSADPALAAALQAATDDAGRRPEVLAALHGARVLAAVSAVAGATGTTAAGLTVDKEADIALALLDDGSGRRALPVFTSLATLARWDTTARPVPVDGPRAAAVAVAEGAAELVVDVAGPRTVTLGEREVRALLRGRPTVPAYDDPELGAAIREVTRHVPGVRRTRLEPCRGADARLTLVLDPSADPAAAARAVAERLAPLAAGLVRGLDLAVVPDADADADAEADADAATPPPPPPAP